jgi:uroporphyrinogen-III synthase
LDNKLHRLEKMLRCGCVYKPGGGDDTAGMNAPVNPPPSHRGESEATDPAGARGPGGLAGLRVCSFESRKGAEMQALIEKHGGIATIAPSMREIPLTENPAVFEFVDELFDDRIDVVLLLTGVGTRALVDVVATRHDRAAFLARLQTRPIIVRGPKPAAVLREWGMSFLFQVPEPNTWRDILIAFDERLPVAGKRIAVQEYGIPNPFLYRELTARGATVLPVPVYRWAMPEDTGPLEQAVRDTIAGAFDVLMFTSANQVHNVLVLAEQIGLRDAWLAAARKAVIASIGPTASETLDGLGLTPDLEPPHPKMGHLALHASEHAAEILRRKRTEGAAAP